MLRNTPRFTQTFVPKGKVEIRGPGDTVVDGGAVEVERDPAVVLDADVVRATLVGKKKGPPSK